jgi:MbtH protein
MLKTFVCGLAEIIKMSCVVHAPELTRESETVPNPFEDPDALYVVLVNAEGQHSLWPNNLSIPDGWLVVHGTDSRQHCLECIEKHWTDMRPMSLIQSERA